MKDITREGGAGDEWRQRRWEVNMVSMDCVSCRRPIPDASGFCPYCGATQHGHYVQPEPVHTQPDYQYVQPEHQYTQPLAPPVPEIAPTPVQMVASQAPISGSAIAALVFSVVGMFTVLGPLLALIFVGRANREIYASGGQLGGSEVARAAKIVAITGLLISLVVAGIWAGLVFYATSVFDSINFS